MLQYVPNAVIICEGEVISRIDGIVDNSCYPQNIALEELPKLAAGKFASIGLTVLEEARAMLFEGKPPVYPLESSGCPENPAECEARQF